MSLNAEEIQHIARLARLKLSDAELERYRPQLEGILDYVGQIQQVADSAKTPSSSLSINTNVTRTDEVTCIPGETAREKFLSPSAMRDGEFLKVPGVFET
ncbi:MAG: Asp-tRNA(Asn)/Glu-tRNA(Gln) amidotransferase subunit GatC [Patescibacteria group bacterium]